MCLPLDYLWRVEVEGAIYSTSWMMIWSSILFSSETYCPVYSLPPAWMDDLDF